ncbi:MAG: hybrid sensor histidine kinase/response regulator [Acidimicrobiia bacterium]
MNDDAELQALFREEVSERAHRLIEAARRMATEGVDPEQVPNLVRDAHTIKGSARVMGYAAMARGAETLEHLWKRIRDGGVPADAELGELLAGLAASLEAAAEAHPAEGTPELANALAGVDGFTTGLAPAPNGGMSPAPAATPAPTEPPPSPHAVDLGGLLSTLEAEVVEESASIENSRLYRLINRSAEAGVDARGLRETLTALRLATAGSPHEVAALAARWERAVEALQQTIEDLQKQAMALAAAPLREVTDAFPRLARYLARKTDKHVRLEILGGEVEVDQQVLQQLADPLRHLIVNAIEHGIESSAERAELGKPATAAVSMRAEVSGGRLRITVEDDGRGVDWQGLEETARARGLVDGPPASQAQLTSFLFLEGTTTRPVRSEFSGDGAGLAVVARAVEALNGGLELTSVPGAGTRVEVAVPAWWALQEVLLVRAGGHLWGIPEPAAAATLPISFADLRPGKGGMELWWRDQSVPVASLSAAVGLPEEEQVEEVVLVTTRAGLVALTAPEVIGARQIAVKALGPLLQGLPHLSGAAVLNGTDVVVMLEPNRLGERARTLPATAGPRARVMVVDDSPGVRQLLAATLASHGFETVVAPGVREALGHLESERIDALVVDYSMPGHDGLELVARVREASPGLPIVMVSAVAGPDVQARARRVGVDVYFDKSDLRQGALAATLQALVESRALRQAT